MPKKEPKKKKGHKRLLPMIFLVFLLCLAANMLLKPTVSVDSAKVPSQASSQAPAEVFTRYLENVVEEQPSETTSAGSEAEAAIIDRVRYTVVKQTDNQVTLEITAPDMEAILGEADKNGASVQDILDVLKSDDLPTKTTELTVDLDENGKMTEPWEFVDAMYGGLITYLNRYVQESEGLE